MTEPQSPYRPDLVDRLLYQVTLVSGAIITNPAGFGDLPYEEQKAPPQPIVTEDGRLLTLENYQPREGEPGFSKPQTAP